MYIKPIRTEIDYKASLMRIDSLIDAMPGTPEFDELEVLSTLIVDYERNFYPSELPDPVSVIEFVMEQRDLSRKDLESCIGGRNRVSEILSRKRSLTLSMIKKLHSKFGIPAELLI